MTLTQVMKFLLGLARIWTLAHWMNACMALEVLPSRAEATLPSLIASVRRQGDQPFEASTINVFFERSVNRGERGIWLRFRVAWRLFQAELVGLGIRYPSAEATLFFRSVDAESLTAKADGKMIAQQNKTDGSHQTVEMKQMLASPISRTTEQGRQNFQRLVQALRDLIAVLDAQHLRDNALQRLCLSEADQQLRGATAPSPEQTKVEKYKKLFKRKAQFNDMALGPWSLVAPPAGRTGLEHGDDTPQFGLCSKCHRIEIQPGELAGKCRHYGRAPLDLM